MDTVSLGCAVVRTTAFDAAMGFMGYLGHGTLGAAVGILVYAYGFIYSRPKTKQMGAAILITLVISGIFVQVLKQSLQMPRPRVTASYGFPSGDASTAFGLAAVLGLSSPVLSPFFFLSATIAAISRLYYRAHFVRDVIAGALLGSGVGIAVTKKLFHPWKIRKSHWTTYLGWCFTLVIGFGAVAFFFKLEKSIEVHRVENSEDSRSYPKPIRINFGTSEARNLLHYGWSVDEKWMGGKLGVVWAEGLASELQVVLPYSADYRFRLHLFPYAPKGPACQRAEIKINDVSVTRLHLDQGWNWYEFRVPKKVIKTGKNDIQFYFDYAQSPKSLGLGADMRRLSAAFSSLQVIPEN